MGTAAEVLRKYKMGDGRLVQKSDNVINLTSRDAADLAPRGITPARVTTFKTVRDTFSNLPTDIELQADVSIAVTAKNAARDVLEGDIQTVRSMAENKFGLTGYYKKFGFEDLTHLTDDNLMRCGRRVARVATLLLSQLTSEGLSAGGIATLKTHTDAFDNAIDAVESAEEVRDIQTQERIEAGNALYDQLMKVASTGQSVFRNTDEAKYNDYLIDDTPEEADAPPTA